MNNVSVQSTNLYTTVCNVQGSSIKLTNTRRKKLYKQLVITRLAYYLYIILGIVFFILLFGILGRIENYTATPTQDSWSVFTYILTIVFSIVGIVANCYFARVARRDTKRLRRRLVE